MILISGSETPALNAQANKLIDNAVKYYFIHAQWHELVEHYESHGVSQVDELSKLLIGIALAFHTSSNETKANGHQLLEHIQNSAIESNLKEDLLMFDAYCTVARAQLVIGRTDRAKEFYAIAFDYLRSFNKEGLASNRLFNDLIDLGFEERATELVKQHRSQNQISSLKKTTDIKSLIAKDKVPVILVAGMRHSGSTALFNVVRIALMMSGYKVHSAYSEAVKIADIDFDDIDIVLLKTHEKRDDVLELADVIISTKRDLRDTVASAVRREFNLCSKLGVREYAKYNRTLYEIWKPLSDHEFNYEVFMNKADEAVEEVLQFLGIDTAMTRKIVDKVNNLPTSQYKRTLLSPTHITDRERKLTFTDTINKEDLELINQQHKSWLVSNGYETE